MDAVLQLDRIMNLLAESEAVLEEVDHNLQALEKKVPQATAHMVRFATLQGRIEAIKGRLKHQKLRLLSAMDICMKPLFPAYKWGEMSMENLASWEGRYDFERYCPARLHDLSTKFEDGEKSSQAVMEQVSNLNLVCLQIQTKLNTLIRRDQKLEKE
ncbi:MAG: hypothetical protein A3B10_00025 [Candidatus Doudnabacteria bacterium RIFCSPLOWO2_01_FULL_44_21]|uniref:Uncharacterized protein n=1 Tax=Candidatus Doudnabacteria bacterium RIFCSPLOWO2_01_FULL_44_21 TaxID=1817841 RepID=A0A1F5PX99_9BACT|nr:MAG: hypothetical protein A3B95_03480 [Candidatus Doudnabacteria bacterium RIFCSPHIGHO2_02_FULL_43_13b]OGE94536.1 MAG: hypothetical protein A3B10_00025 [Candidatus Doudnabacteria bacterium RIFCSPLOWO2_01_FULL_44_21]